MISVQRLVKRYGSHLALDDVSFHVARGEVCGFLGPNGAGKSTTLRILSGFLGKTSGTVTVDGFDVDDASLSARAAIGYMPESVPLYPEMRVGEYLVFRAELKGVPRAKRRAKVDLAMEKARVDDVASVLIGHLSKGYRQRVGLADALVAEPPLLVLDEPTAGLDPNQIREVRQVIGGLGQDHTVLVSTHILSEVEATCSRVVVIAKGKVVADGATADVRGMGQARALDIVVRGEAAKAVAVLAAVPGVSNATRVAEQGEVVTLRCAWADDARAPAVTEETVRALVGAGFGVREVRAAGSALEDVFRQLTENPS
jgi:ABC-2 type transport system ATP-binding protein